MSDSQIFKATYSGVPVFEMQSGSVSVMRRQVDGWLNATQILKVAGFDKPQRTRILERDVQKGEHEKVQGGFGKYQGTWVPADRGLEIAHQYHCDGAIQPIIDFNPERDPSPPPAPKHFSSAADKRKRNRELASLSTRSRRSTAKDHSVDYSDDDETVLPTRDMSSSPRSRSTSRTASPVRGDSTSPPPTRVLAAGRSPRGPQTRKLRSRRGAKNPASQPANLPTERNQHIYAQDILDYFISDSTAAPELLAHPPPDFDPNVSIDDDGHTAIHWACAMGRLRIVKLLIACGADIYRINRNGQTCLMRAVMFANNYDVRKFPELYDLLHRTTLNIDSFNRTVFHRCVDLAMSKGKTHAARYYMEIMLNHLSAHPAELKDIINWRDDDGETALTMAARCRSKRLVKLLLDHGADPKIKNNEDKNAEAYIIEDERFRASPGLAPAPRVGPSKSSGSGSSNNSATTTLVNDANKSPVMGKSTAAMRATARLSTDLNGMLEALASNFDVELESRERLIERAKVVTANVDLEVTGLGRTVAEMQVKTERLDASKRQLAELEAQFVRQIMKRQRRGMKRWIQERQAGTTTTTGDDTATSLKRKRGGDHDFVPPDDIDVSVLPTDEEEIRLACTEMRVEISQQRKRRRVAFEELARVHAQVGTGAKTGEYRRLLRLVVPEMSLDELEAALPLVVESLESDTLPLPNIAVAAAS